jgi:hypothetical protein
MANRYDQVISEFVKQTTLKRIRIKTDPKATSDFAYANEYEGFVLEEDGLGNVVVYVPELGDELEVPFGDYTPCGTDESGENPHLDGLKQHIITDLIESNDLDEDDPEIENISVLSCIHQLHNHLNEKNIDDDQFLDILKGYFENE